MSNALPIAYHGGAFVPAGEAQVPAGSLAMRYALSVFEGVRLYLPAGGAARPVAFRLGEHLARLRRSLDKLEDARTQRRFDEAQWHCLLAAYF